MNARAVALAPVALLALLAAGCGEKPKEPKVDAATEQKEAFERAKKGPYGTQMKAYEKAQNMGTDVNNKVQESVDKAADSK